MQRAWREPPGVGEKKQQQQQEMEKEKQEEEAWMGERAREDAIEREKMTSREREREREGNLTSRGHAVSRDFTLLPGVYLSVRSRLHPRRLPRYWDPYCLNN